MTAHSLRPYAATIRHCRSLPICDAVSGTWSRAAARWPATPQWQALQQYLAAAMARLLRRATSRARTDTRITGNSVRRASMCTCCSESFSTRSPARAARIATKQLSQLYLLAAAVRCSSTRLARASAFLTASRARCPSGAPCGIAPCSRCDSALPTPLQLLETIPQTLQQATRRGTPRSTCLCGSGPSQHAQALQPSTGVRSKLAISLIGADLDHCTAVSLICLF